MPLLFPFHSLALCPTQHNYLITMSVFLIKLTCRVFVRQIMRHKIILVNSTRTYFLFFLEIFRKSCQPRAKWMFFIFYELKIPVFMSTTGISGILTYAAKKCSLIASPIFCLFSQPSCLTSSDCICTDPHTSGPEIRSFGESADTGPDTISVWIIYGWTEGNVLVLMCTINFLIFCLDLSPEHP